MFESEHFARAREAGLNLVGDEQDFVLVAKRPERAQEIERRDVEASLALYRLDDDGSDARRVGGVLEQGIEGNEALVAANSMIIIGKSHVIDLGRERAEPLLVGNDLARERHAH